MSGDGWWYDDTRLFLDGFNYEGPGHTTKDGKQAVIYKTGSKTLDIRVRGDSYINATGMYGIYDDSSEYGETHITSDGKPFLLSIRAPLACIKSNKAGMDFMRLT